MSNNKIKFTTKINSNNEDDIKLIDDNAYENLCKHGDCYEVIPDDQPVKVYFDVETGDDYSVENDNMIEMAPHILRISKEAINKYCNELLNIEPIYAISSSHSNKYIDYKKQKEMWKISYHIVLQNVIGDKKQQLQMVNALNDYAKQTDIRDYTGNDKKLFDDSVYSKSRKMRSVYASKPNENRPFVIEEGTFNENIISAFVDKKAVILPDVEIVVRDNKTPYTGIIPNNDENLLFINLCFKDGLLKKRSIDYKEWFEMGCALKNTFGDSAYGLFNTFSNFYKHNHDELNNRKIWDTMRTDGGLTMGSIKDWAKKENKETYKSINDKIKENKKSKRQKLKN